MYFEQDSKIFIDMGILLPIGGFAQWKSIPKQSTANTSIYQTNDAKSIMKLTVSEFNVQSTSANHLQLKLVSFQALLHILLV